MYVRFSWSSPCTQSIYEIGVNFNNNNKLTSEKMHLNLTTKYLIIFHGNPNKEDCQLVAGFKENDYDQYYLYTNGPEKSWNWIYWEKAGEAPKDLLIKIRVEYAGISKRGKQYRLIWDNNGTNMFLNSEGESSSEYKWGYI